MKLRQSNFELLRLVAILMVLVGHVNGIAFPSIGREDLLSFPTWYGSRMFLSCVCGVAVDAFILISGYFSIRLKVKSVLNFLYLIFFWRVLTYVGQVSCGFFDFSFASLITGINPMRIWFVREYVTLMLLSPLLNAFCEKGSKCGMSRYIACFYVVVCLADFIVPLKYWGLFTAGYSAMWFVGLYLIGRYIALYGLGSWYENGKICLIAFLMISVLSASIRIAIMIMGLPPAIASVSNRFMTGYTSPFVLVGAILLFGYFRTFRFSSRIINHLALSAFAIYLAHSPTCYFWKCIRKCYGYGPLRVFLFVVFVVVGIVLIDQIRIYSYRLISQVWDRFINAH